ncbi:hypothetical protein RFI_29854 [Reticulomyxa filosa]|uniref:Uncharacterized protein n=1 Tax=Reticulomyxa filosa TaxID=46433 RepID=X6M299_RETFI|nr:hypothetical protein RFI_29854 [Reticulomyxa filosa]|eukprot:ETO07537.1 hypothetical protein RFI_29854 [Reticulomyxa filosa]
MSIYCYNFSVLCPALRLGILRKGRLWLRTSERSISTAVLTSLRSSLDMYLKSSKHDVLKQSKELVELRDFASLEAIKKDMEENKVQKTKGFYTWYVRSLAMNTTETTSEEVDMTLQKMKTILLEDLKRDGVQLTMAMANLYLRGIALRYRKMSQSQYLHAITDALHMLKGMCPTLQTYIELMRLYHNCNKGKIVWLLLLQAETQLFSNANKSKQNHTTLVLSLLRCIEHCQDSLLQYKIATHTKDMNDTLAFRDQIYQDTIVTVVEHVFKKSVENLQMIPSSTIMTTVLSILCAANDRQRILNYFEMMTDVLDMPVYSRVIRQCLEAFLPKEIDTNTTTAMDVERLILTYRFVELLRWRTDFHIQDTMYLHRYVHLIRQTVSRISTCDDSLFHVLQHLPSQMQHIHLEYAYNRYAKQDNMHIPFHLQTHFFVPVLQCLLSLEGDLQQNRMWLSGLITYWLDNNHIQKYLWPDEVISSLDLAGWGDIELQSLLLCLLLNIQQKQFLQAITNVINVRLSHTAISSSELSQCKTFLLTWFPHLKIDTKQTSNGNVFISIDLDSLQDCVWSQHIQEITNNEPKLIENKPNLLEQ